MIKRILIIFVLFFSLNSFADDKFYSYYDNCKEMSEEELKNEGKFISEEFKKIKGSGNCSIENKPLGKFTSKFSACLDDGLIVNILIKGKSNCFTGLNQVLDQGIKDGFRVNRTKKAVLELDNLDSFDKSRVFYHVDIARNKCFRRNKSLIKLELMKSVDLQMYENCSSKITSEKAGLEYIQMKCNKLDNPFFHFYTSTLDQCNFILARFEKYRNKN